MTRPRTRAGRLAEQYGFGPRVATHHSRRLLHPWEETIIGLGAGAACVACIVNLGLGWFFLGLPVVLLHPARTWWGQPAEVRRRFFLYERGLVIQRQNRYTAVPWSWVDSVVYKKKRGERDFYNPRRITYYAAVLELKLKDSNRIHLHPVTRHRTLRDQLIALTGRRYSRLAGHPIGAEPTATLTPPPIPESEIEHADSYEQVRRQLLDEVELVLASTGDRERAASLLLVTHYRQLGDDDERVQHARRVMEEREQSANAD